MGCGVGEITNPSSFSCVLTDSYRAAGGDVQPTVKTLKDVVERWTGGVKTHDVEYMWGCRTADKYGGKNSTVIKKEMQSWINAQRRHCADPRLDRTRDASLKHQRKHGAARKQLRSTLWIFFSLFFALFSTKNHYNGECLKILLKPRKQDRHGILFRIFFSAGRIRNLDFGREKLLWWEVSQNAFLDLTILGAKKKFYPRNF